MHHIRKISETAKKRGDETCNAAGPKITRRFSSRKRDFNKRFHPFTSCKIIHRPIGWADCIGEKENFLTCFAAEQQQFRGADGVQAATEGKSR
jgi:hypothetical protein